MKNGLMMFSICYAYFSLLVCWCIALMVSKRFHFKKGLKSAHKILLCAVVLKPRFSRMEKCLLRLSTSESFCTKNKAFLCKESCCIHGLG